MRRLLLVRVRADEKHEERGLSARSTREIWRGKSKDFGNASGFYEETRSTLPEESS